MPSLLAIIALTATLLEPVLGFRFVKDGQVAATPGPYFPDQWISFEVTVTAPDDEALEEPEIAAANQHKDYFEHRPGPNLHLSVVRLGGDGSRTKVQCRVASSGGGQSLREYSRQVAFHVLGDQEARRARMKALLGPAAAMEAQIAYLDGIYVSNPPGRYEVTIEYRPVAGRFSGKGFSKTFEVVIERGPDSLDRIERNR